MNEQLRENEGSLTVRSVTSETSESLPDFSEVTELPGSPATSAQLERLAQRYQFATAHVAERRVLEVACGAGLGLGILQTRSRFVVGGDCTESLLKIAKAHYSARVPLVRLDAHWLPFPTASFDAVLLFEAIYYLRDVQAFLRETYRVLAPNGVLLISSVNPDCGGLSASSHSTTYYGLSKLTNEVRQAGFEVVACFGGFPTAEGTWVNRAVEEARKIAAALHLIPRTLRTRVLLKRLFYGRTQGLPAEIGDSGTSAPPLTSVQLGVEDRTHRIIYLVARKG